MQTGIHARSKYQATAKSCTFCHFVVFEANVLSTRAVLVAPRVPVTVFVVCSQKSHNDPSQDFVYVDNMGVVYCISDSYTHTHIYIYIYIYIYIHTYIQTYTRRHIYIFRYMHMHMCISIHICRHLYIRRDIHIRIHGYLCKIVCVHVHVRAYVYVYVYVYVHVYVYVCVHACTYP